MSASSISAGSRKGRAIITVMLLAAVLAACGGGDDGSGGGSTDTPEASGPRELVGLFKIDPGTCTDAGVTAGSSFRMVQGSGTLDAGPFVPNGDSSCGDKSWNPILPGVDGGLRTAEFQILNDPPFDSAGNATTEKITKTVKFFAVGFAVATNEKDPQTGATVTAPKIMVDGGKLSGDLRAFAASWNKQHFNQGSPKPDGSKPGITSDLTGTYDSATKRYTLQWASQIVGGPFNNFTGVWRLEGTFEPAT